MGPLELGVISLGVIVLLIYAGLYIPVVLALVSFVSVWLMRGNIDIAINLLTISVKDTVSDYNFATVPLFTMMGLIVSKAGLGRDVYEVANQIFRAIRGGLGIATVAANAIFASVTGSSIASASVFTKVSVPEMRRFHYGKRFAVGVVAGSSVLGMLIPPSVMLIIYAVVAEQSIGAMFLAGVVPGLLLATVFGFAILIMAWLAPRFVGGGHGEGGERTEPLISFREIMVKLVPVVLLILVVLGGIYGGVFTPTEAGAAGGLMAILIAAARRRLTLRSVWEALVETGHITATILFLIIAASTYSRMLGIAGLPTLFGEWMQSMDLNLAMMMAIYVLLLIVLGTILDTASIILVVVPLFLTAVEAFGADLVWFGIVTVIGAEIGLLTPPLGLSCFVIKSTIDDPSISLADVFLGALPFAAVMLVVLIFVIAFPQISLVLVR
ncbi:MAG: TRAP transporter large permease [Pseudomonadota bacterium]